MSMTAIVEPDGTTVRVEVCGKDDSLTKFDVKRFFETSVQAKVLLSLYMGLCSEVLSGDVMALAAHHAKNIAIEHGVDEDDFCEIAGELIEYWKTARAGNPMSGMF